MPLPKISKVGLIFWLKEVIVTMLSSIRAGCSSCALSFCKKCLSYRAIVPSLADYPITVCYDCYQKIEAGKSSSDARVTSTPITSHDVPLGPGPTLREQVNWWGEGLPPPSFRQQQKPQPQIGKARLPRPMFGQPQLVAEDDAEGIKELERRRARLREMEEPDPGTVASLEEIEQRLASLRGCDVELVRNPKLWFEQRKNEPRMEDTPSGLIEMTKNRAALDMAREAAEEKELEELEQRHKKLYDAKSHPEGDDLSRLSQTDSIARMSVTSDVSEFSTATKEQMESFNRIMKDAEKKVQENQAREGRTDQDMRQVLAATRQKSLDAMKMNEKVNNEFGKFWDRQLEKSVSVDTDDEESVDEETLKKIIHEAEMTEVDTSSEQQNKKTAPSGSNTNSPKKRGFFSKIFNKDSK